MKNAMRFMFAVAGLACFFSSCSKKEESNELRIGGIFSLSGDVAVYGMECRDGVDLAVKQINEIGGINGKQIAIITEDDEGNPEKTMNAYKKLTSKDGIKIIIGSLTSGCTKAITAQAQAQKVLQIAPAATEPSITDAGKYIFRTCFIDPFQGVVGGKFSYENLGKRNAAILYDVTNDYCVGLSENFKSEFTKLGGVIVAEESYSKGDKDFNAQLTKIKQANPDVVYLPDYYNTVSLIAKQLRAQGIDTPIVGADGWGGIIGTAGEEVTNGFYSDHYSPDSTEPVVRKFVDDFKTSYGRIPTSFAALGYDCVWLLKDAIELAGTDSDNDAIVAAIEGLNGSYVTGNLTFDEKHNPIKSAVMLELVKEGEGLATRYHSTINP